MKKIMIITVIAIVIIVIAIQITMKIQEDLAFKRQEELEKAYETQNMFFGPLVNTEIFGFEGRDKYRPIHLRGPNIDGIDIPVYRDLELFRQQTGVNLTYEMVLDYLSQEYEDDGKIRIWTNGRHPEIADYFEWVKWSSTLGGEFSRSLSEAYFDYADENAPFPTINNVNTMPLEMFRALVRKVADPDYELDLTSIQNRYIAEGKAVVSEDGLSIEFIVPERNT
jgi:hypothetical protein